MDLKFLETHVAINTLPACSYSEAQRRCRDDVTVIAAPDDVIMKLIGHKEERFYWLPIHKDVTLGWKWVTGRDYGN